MPVIAARKSFSLPGSAYNVSNSPGPPPLTSFCGAPVRSASVRLPQNGYSRWLAISRMPPIYDGLALSRNRSVSGVFEYRSPLRARKPSATSVSRKSRAARGCRPRRWVSASSDCAPRASSLNTPNSIALKSVFEARTRGRSAGFFRGLAVRSMLAPDCGHLIVISPLFASRSK